MQKKNRIEKIYKEYMKVKEDNLSKWSENFFFNLFSENNIFFLSFSKPALAYLIARKIIDEYEILSIATDVNNRRKGFSATLLKKLLNRAKKEKIKRILLEVSKNNNAAISMYEKFGFKKISERSNYYKENTKLVDAIIMERRLVKCV